MKFNAALFLLAHMLPAASAFLVAPLRSVRQDTASLHATTVDNSISNDGIDAAKALREKAAQLRAEIAALEGKSVDQVEQEAKDKKDQALNAKSASLEARKAPSKPVDYGKMMEVPTGSQDMVYQAARAVERAYADGIKRQTVRFVLLAEGQGVSQETNEWPGGSAQMYREAGKPLTSELLREIRLNTNVGSPNVRAQDIWDFDGSAIHYAEAKDSAKDDVQAMVFANTDVKYLRDIDAIDKDMGDRLFLLVNPFWRNVESWGFNILAPGAKQKAQATIFDKGYDETYSLLRFSVRGEDCVALKAYPYDWQLYVYLENEMGWVTPIRLGSSKTEPKTDYVTDLINARPEFKLSKNMRQLSRGR
jgi:hypothetical protein